MDRRERYQKGQPFQSFAKGFAAGLILLIPATGCTHKTALPGNLTQAIGTQSGAALDVSSMGIQLTKQGENLSPTLSADGKKVVYVSRKRPSHAQGQIYIYDLDSLKERRVTYQDGDCQDPILLVDDQVIYASTTDELKERPTLLQKAAPASPYPPSELYMSEISGENIVRLTHHEGFDGSPWQRSDRPQSLIFSQWNGKALNALQMNLKTRQVIPLLSSKDSAIKSMRSSPDGKQWAWIENSANGSSEVLLSNAQLSSGKQKTLKLPKGDYRDLIWASNQKIIFSAKSLKKYYQLYSYDLNSNCLQSLFETSSDLTSPSLNQEHQAVVFASASNGSSQLFYKSLPTSNECLKWEETVKN